jgi:hypothetical protein
MQRLVPRAPAASALCFRIVPGAALVLEAPVLLLIRTRQSQKQVGSRQYATFCAALRDE